jgi:hypothetical protein
MITTAQVTVGTSPVQIIPENNVNRWVYIHHDSNQSIWIGNSTVSNADGFHLHKTSYHQLYLPANASLYAISDLAGQVVDVLYQSD